MNSRLSIQVVRKPWFATSTSLSSLIFTEDVHRFSDSTTTMRNDIMRRRKNTDSWKASSRSRTMSSTCRVGCCTYCTCIVGYGNTHKLDHLSNFNFLSYYTTKAVTPCHPYHPQYALARRAFGSTRDGNKRQHKNKQQQYMVNEHLIRVLMHKKNGPPPNADTLMVRLLVDEAQLSLSKQSDSENECKNENEQKRNNHQTSTNLVSLSEAINISTNLDVDLVGISLQQSTPVLRAVDYSKFLYEQSLKQSKMNKKSAKNMKSNKEFTFRAGIDENDLERKLNNMISYLQKGHSCLVIMTSNRRNLLEDQNIISTTLERIQSYVGEHGNPQGQLKTNPIGNRGSILFQPKSKK